MDPTDRDKIQQVINDLISDPRMDLLYKEFKDYKSSPIFVIDFIVFFLVSILYEEFFFRVLLFDVLIRLGVPLLIGFIISCVSFGMSHYFVTRSILAVFTTGLIGFFFLCNLFSFGALDGFSTSCSLE